MDQTQTQPSCCSSWFELVLADKDGKPIAGGAQITAGEKYWSKAVSWIKIDITEHTLELKIPFADPTGRASFTATITVAAAIANSLKLAASAATSVKDYLEPGLHEAVETGAGTVVATLYPDPVTTLNEARRLAEAALRSSMRGGIDDLPSWLTAKVKSISVAFDDTTRKHYEELVKSAREGELIDATAENDQREATHAIGLRDKWREALVEHLSDPATRSFEVVFSDPSPQNIARVVAQVNATDAVARERVFQVLSSLIEADHLNKTSELPEMMKEIMAGLRIGEGQDAPALEAATPPAIDAEAHTEEHAEPQGADS